jgi:N utilization substance protein B
VTATGDEPPPFGSRREARETALGLLYEADVRGESPRAVLGRQIVEPVAYVRDLLTGVDDHLDEIDDLLRGASREWRLERMPILDRSVLRIGVFELAHRPDVPTGVVLSEAVDLASRYSTDESGRFVNGVLAALARRIRGN